MSKEESMNNKKLLVLFPLLALTLTGCGDKGNSENPSTNPSSSEAGTSESS